MSFFVEKICDTSPWNNGAGPMWTYGNSCLLRVGDRVFFTTNYVQEDRAPQNNTCMVLYEKNGSAPWRQVFCDEGRFQREPCQLLYLGDDRLALFTAPTRESYPPQTVTSVVPACPMVYVFDISGEVKKCGEIVLPWDEPDYPFRSHTYRGCARDALTGNLFFDCIYYLPGTDGFHCYSVLDDQFRPIRMSKLDFPERGLYHNVVMHGGETYLFALTGVKEKNEEWAAYKEQMGGFDWVFQKLYMKYTPDITRQEFGPAQVVCDVSATGGWVSNMDCCRAGDDVLFLTEERNIDEAYMRDRFLPDLPLRSELVLYRYRGGSCVGRVVVDAWDEGDGPRPLYAGVLHTAADGRVYVVWSRSSDKVESVYETDEAGLRFFRPGTKRAGEEANGTAAYLTPADSPQTPPVLLMRAGDAYYGKYYANKARLGAPAGNTVDLCWSDYDRALMYAKIDLPRWTDA